MPNSIKFNFDDKSKKELQEVLSITDKLFTNLEKISTKKIKVQSSKELAAEQEKANTTTKKSIDLTTQLEKAQRDLLAAQTTEGKQLVELRTEKAKLNAETRKQYKEATALLSPYEKLTKTLKDAKKAAKDIAVEFGTNSKEYAKVKEEVQKLDKEYKDLNSELGDNQVYVGEYTRALEGLFPALGSIREGLNNFTESQSNMASSTEGATSALATFKTGVGNAAKAALAFVTTPIGAAVLALASIGIATKKFFDFNDAILETNLLLEGITNQTGDAVNNIRVRAEALAEVFDKDIKESTLTAQKLVVQFGISYGEAFDTIEEGLIRGGAANDEFLDSLAEYGQFFSNAGFSVDEFQQIVNAGFDLGIYKDKLPDAVKEFDVSIREQTEATKEALLNAFGADFTNTLLDGVKSGAITTKEALAEIAAQTEEFGVNSQQAAQLTADLFRGAGEDAGGYQKVIEAVNLGLEEQQREYNSLESFQRANIESTKALKEAQDEAFRSDDFVKFKTILITGWNNIKIAILNGIISIKNSFSSFTNGLDIIQGKIQPIIDKIKSFVSESNLLTTAFGFVKKAFENTINPLDKLFTALTAVAGVFNGLINVAFNFSTAFTQTFTALKEAFENFDISKPIESFKSLDFSGVYQAGQDLGNSFIDGYNEVVSAESIAKSIVDSSQQEIKSTSLGTQSGGGSGGSNARVKSSVQSIVTKEDVQNIDQLTKEIEDILNDSSDKINNLINSQVDSLTQSYEDGYLSAEDFITQLEQVQKDSSKQVIEYMISDINEIVDATELSVEERKQLETELVEYEKQLRQINLEEIKAAAQSEIDAEEQKDAEILKSAEERAERQKELTKQIAQATITAASMVGDELFSQQSTRLENELSLAQKRYDYEILLAESSGESTEAINARKLASAEVLARKEAQIKEKQARADKAQAIFQAVINTAAAVVEALPNYVSAGIAGALGAVQIALIASRPIPKFKTGVEDFEGGLATVGDGGRELVRLPNKEMLLVERETTLNLPKGTDVIKNSETEKMLKSGKSDKNTLLLERIANKKSSFKVYNTIVNKENRTNYNLRK